MVLERLIVVFRETLIALIPNRPLRLLVGGVVLVCVLALLILLVRLVFRWLDRRLRSWKGRVFRPVRWQAQELLSEQDVSNAIRGVGRVARNLVYVLVSLAVLQLVFVLMPETSALGRTLLGYFIDAAAGVFNAFVGFLPSLATLIVLYFLAAYTVKFAGVVFRGIENGRIRIVGFEQEWSPITYKIIRGSVWVLFVVVAFPYFPLSGSPAFQGLSIFFGVLFSLGGSQMVSNVIAGVMLTYMNAFKVGDRVKIADAEGVIVAKTTHVTRVRTPKNVTISVPNALVMSNHIINFTTLARDDEEGVILHTTVTIAYDVRWQQVEELLVAAAKTTALIESAPEPFVLQTSLDDFYVAYQINAFTHESRKMPQIRSDLHRNIQTAFHAAGVEIASPHLSALRDGNVVNIPEDDLPKNYRPASFRVTPLGGWPRDTGSAPRMTRDGPGRTDG